MRIRSYHDLPGCRPSFLHRHLVADPRIDVIVENILLCGKLPHVHMVTRSGQRVCWYLVIKEHDDTFRVKDPLPAHLVELLDSQGPGNIMDHCTINRCHDDFS